MTDTYVSRRGGTVDIEPLLAAQSEVYLPSYSPKESPHKSSVHYDSRIIRQVEPGQPELKRALNQLRATTGDFIDYQSVGALGVTLAILDPALKHIVGTDKRGEISKGAIREFEAELNDELDIRSLGTDFALQNANSPFEIYGQNQDTLGITLSTRDSRLYGQRIVAENYIREEYPGVSSRFGAHGLTRITPHIAIGTVMPQYMSGGERRDLYRNPSDFVLDRAMHAQQREAETYGISHEIEPIEFPEHIALGGLKVVCAKC